MRSTIAFLGTLCFTGLSAQFTPPYSTSFEGAVGTLNTNFPPGWTWEDLNTIAFGNQGWQIIKNSQNAQNARTDSTAAHMFSHSSQANNDWLYSPAMVCAANASYRIRFWYSRAASFPSTEKLALHVGTEATSAAMGTPLWQNVNITSGAYQQATVDWVAPADGEYHFGFHYFSAEFQFILLLDDVSIQPLTVGLSEVATPVMVLWRSGDRLLVRQEGTATELSITDAAGRNVLQQRLGGTYSEVGIGHLPAGLYIARIAGPDGKGITRRFVVDR